MKIRTSLASEESEEKTSSSNKKIITFYGRCFGVRLFTRGLNDPHILFQIIVEDDGYWAESRSGTMTSSHWISDITSILNHAERWMKYSCKKDFAGWREK